MRSYGRFTTSIFRDEDFKSLTAAEQGAYFLLGLQPEMSAAGKLDLTLRRWSGMSGGMTRDELAETLSVLEARGHIIVDWDTEELLIVKFVKWDGGLDNSKRYPVIREAALAIASKRIRHTLAHELVGIGHADLAHELENGLSGSDRSVVTLGEYVDTPHSAISNPESTLPEGEPVAPPIADGPLSPFCSKHPNGTEKPCGPCGTAKLRFARWEKSETVRKPRPKWCGHCDEATRQVLDVDTQRPISRCAACHPISIRAVS